MKYLAFFLFGFNCLCGQTTHSLFSIGSITTADINPSRRINFPVAIEWYVADTLNAGVDSCTHKWLSSEPYSYSGGFGQGITISCLVMHPPGTRCSWTIQTRKSICSKCLMHIVETDENPNPVVPEKIPEPEETYESLLNKINKHKKNEN